MEAHVHPEKKLESSKHQDTESVDRGQGVSSKRYSSLVVVGYELRQISDWHVHIQILGVIAIQCRKMQGRESLSYNISVFCKNGIVSACPR